jgi:UDP-N-acetylmuramoyl-tripeptide--D-alanyl-D-alanine ligase
MTAVLAVVAVATGLVSLVRWLRVTQREHYLPGQVARTAWRWAICRPPNIWIAGAVVGLAAAGVFASLVSDPGLAPVLMIISALLAAAFPLGMHPLGKIRLKWTRRVSIQAGIAFVVGAVILAVLALPVGAPALGLAPIVALVAVDVAAWLQGPIERRLSRRFQTQAAAKLGRIRPTVVAVTGSYGKTTVKNHIHDLLAGSFTTVASPASWNNQNGLSRAINEHVGPDTEVFVAEMGTYGPGEIAAMVSWVKPQVAIMSAIGPVHLERMGTLERIVEAKSEILDGAETVILNVDHPLLDDLAGRVGATLWRVGTDPARDDLDVLVTLIDDASAPGLAPAAASASASTPALTENGSGNGEGAFDAVGETPGGEPEEDRRQLVVTVRGDELARIPAGSLQPSNIACAVAAALAVGAAPKSIATALPRLSPPPNRAVPLTTEDGVTVIDDTFNSNPAGAAAAFATLQRLAQGGRHVVVTPGMVELGRAQFEANRTFAHAVAAAGADLVAVGWTNREALVEGHPRAELVPDHFAARAWVRANLGSGDAVLWENDLPDHYP